MAYVLSPTNLLLACLAGWINREQQRMIEYLQAENKVLREMLGESRLRFNDDQRRRLAAKGKEVGRKGLLQIGSLVTPDTLLRWHRQLIAEKWTFKRKTEGRPKTKQEIAELVLKMAKENLTWGYLRIAGELASLGHEICANTVKAILKESGLERAPERRKGMSWTDFIKTHWETLAACDFFTTEVWTKNGLITFYIFFVMELKTRRVSIAGITTQPDSAFMTQVAKELTNPFDGFLLGKSHLLMDRDTKFTEQFRGILKSEGVSAVQLPPRSPNLNAYAERWVRSIKEECLGKMILFGEKMLRHTISNYVAHYHTERCHQGLNNKHILPDSSTGSLEGEIVCSERLGGLLKYYHREPPAKAA